MAVSKSIFVCQSCGGIFPQWSGRCSSCGTWGSIAEESKKALGVSSSSQKISFSSLSVTTKPPARLVSGIGEFDRVCGGGLVPGSAILLSGEPGIGKSTLLLQILAALETRGEGANTAYISGEESLDQIRLRAHRLSLQNAPVLLAGETETESIASTLDVPGCPSVVVIDSIQTLRLSQMESAAGTISQVRTSVQLLTQIAKKRGFSIIFVGHVTKEGLIAGPKAVEHIVDCVLSFESERGQSFRILRASKNRFGSTNELGVFAMSGAGLEEVSNPSAIFLGESREKKIGAAAFAGIEGSRPLLLEVQALVAPTSLAIPRRATIGWDSSRLSMLLAVLEARCGLSFRSFEVYLNVAGGLKIWEPALDLAAVAALVSARLEKEISPEMIFFGEIGLSGELRPISRRDLRLQEAAKLGFHQAVLPAKGTEESFGLSLLPMKDLRDFLSWFGWTRSGRQASSQKSQQKSLPRDIKAV